MADDTFTQSLTSRLEKHYGRLCADSGEFMPNAPLQVCQNENASPSNKFMRDIHGSGLIHNLRNRMF